MVEEIILIDKFTRKTEKKTTFFYKIQFCTSDFYKYRTVMVMCLSLARSFPLFFSPEIVWKY